MRIKYLTLAISLMLPSMALAQQSTAPVHNLMPVPASVQFLDGRSAVSSSFKVASTGFTDARLTAAIDRFSKRLSGRTGLTFVPGLPTDKEAATVWVQTSGAGQTIPSLDENETYQLEISSSRVQLVAPTVVGAMRGLETLLQLLKSDR